MSLVCGAGDRDAALLEGREVEGKVTESSGEEELEVGESGDEIPWKWGPLSHGGCWSVDVELFSGVTLTDDSEGLKTLHEFSLDFLRRVWVAIWQESVLEEGDLIFGGVKSLELGLRYPLVIIEDRDLNWLHVDDERFF